MRRTFARALAAAALGVALNALPAGVASASTHALNCKSGDLRYPFMPGGPKTFGVFTLRISGGTCRVAHKVAKDWKTRFESALRAGKVKLPKSVDGFSFTTVPAKAAQTYSERGTKGTMTIRFDYRVPNG